MGSSNMVMIIGAIVLFGIFLTSSNKLMIANTEIASQNEYYIAALAIAQSVIDEAKTKAFDQNTVAGPIGSPSSLTVKGLLGPDGVTESVPNPDTLTSTGYKSMTKFNDIDDYNGYMRLVNTPRSEGDTVRVTVGYASETSPDSSKSTQTFCKVMTVTVRSRYISSQTAKGFFTDSPVTLSYAFLY